MRSVGINGYILNIESPVFSDRKGTKCEIETPRLTQIWPQQVKE